MESKELKIRLACIDAPEKKQARGTAAQKRLESILSNGGKVTIEPLTTDKYGRTVAIVWNDSGLVQSQMVLSGDAFAYDDYADECPEWDAVKYSEDLARGDRLGVWADNKPEFPWEWRRSNK